MSASSPDSSTDLLGAFRQELAHYGYVEGRDIAIEWRFAEGSFDRMPALAADLVAMQVAVIVVAAASDALVVQRASSTIPIVVAGISGDLVDAGLATSLARPGGNVTGLSIPVELRGRSLQLLMESAPGVSKLAVLADAVQRDMTALQGPYSESFGQRLGVSIQILSLSRPDELDGVFAGAREEGIDGLFIANTPFTIAQRGRIIALAAEHHLPAIYGRRVFVDDGGLMSYQPRITDLYRRAAFYVDRILQGTSPTDLPVEQPMTFDFIINLRTAQALGITIPQHVLLQATEVIQ